MGSHLHEITAALAKLLKGDENTSVFSENPAFVREGDWISLYLYQVVPDEFSRNRNNPVIREATAARPTRQVGIPPLGLNLYYLITPLSGHLATEQNELGKALLRIHESPILSVVNPDVGLHEEVRISLLSETLEDRCRLWEALSKPYRLSFCILVRTAQLLSANRSDEAPVITIASPEATTPART